MNYSKELMDLLTGFDARDSIRGPALRRVQEVKDLLEDQYFMDRLTNRVQEDSEDISRALEIKAKEFLELLKLIREEDTGINGLSPRLGKLIDL